MGASCTCSVSPMVVETRAVVNHENPTSRNSVIKKEGKPRFQRHSELSVASDDNPRQVYIIRMSAVLLNPSDCPQLVDFILDKPVVMVEIDLVVNKQLDKLKDPDEIIKNPVLDWDGLDVKKQIPKTLTLQSNSTRVYGVLSKMKRFQLQNETVTLSAMLLGQKEISLTTEILEDKEFSLRDVTEMFKCFIDENNALKKTSGENDKDGSSRRSSRQVSFSDGSSKKPEQIRKISVEETITVVADFDPKSASIPYENRTRRKSSGKKKRNSKGNIRKTSREEVNRKNSKEEVQRWHSNDQRRINTVVRKVTPHVKIFVGEVDNPVSKEPTLRQVVEEDDVESSSVSENQCASTCSSGRRPSTCSFGYSSIPGCHFEPISELSAEEDEEDIKTRQRSVSVA